MKGPAQATILILAMRIAHLTDIHVTEKPRFAQIWGKRLWGSFQLFGLGRAAQFSREVQEKLADAVIGLEPDLVVVTGDLTSQALPQEFEQFRAIYEPLFSRQDTILLPGNHDTYTWPTAGGVRADAYLQPWIGEGEYPRVREVRGVVFVSICCSRPGVYARGLCPEEQLVRLDSVLRDPGLQGKTVVLLMHYAMRDSQGGPYDVYYECLANANALEAVIGGHGDRISVILHGHVHRGYRTELRTPRGRVPILNPGCSGYAWDPSKKRTAQFSLMDLNDGHLEVERYGYNGDSGQFEREQGGAFSTGW